MCCGRVTRLQLELNLGVIDSPRRRHNTSGGYKSTDKAKTWMALEFIPVFTSTRQIAIPLHTLAR